MDNLTVGPIKANPMFGNKSPRLFTKPPVVIAQEYLDLQKGIRIAEMAERIKRHAAELGLTARDFLKIALGK